ncbi:hypothetical protein K474DRAFT_1601468 [Panus rudis PR-1116 ss-1]|nr:hypothetical protein K474DRAFT_1601468 [Panus rudis PR-1116 ss-1]
MSKKGTKAPPPPESTYEIRDIVLAKVRGYAPWPAMVVNPDSVPPFVTKERPNKKNQTGNWYCVRFFPAGDYAWLRPGDLSKLQRHEIQAFLADPPSNKKADLIKGYRIALDPAKWEEEMEAVTAAAAEAEENAEVDQLDESDGEHEAEDDDEEVKKKPKKRKRESDVPAKKTKAKPAKKDTEPASAAKKKANGGPKAKKNGVKSKAMVESEDEGGAAEEEDAGPSKKTSPPPAKKAKRDKDVEEETEGTSLDPEAEKVKSWRHKLQKAFLSKGVPKDEDMPALSELFSVVENYDGMTINYLQYSKIGKVMRHIHVLPTDKVPRDDEFKFRERAKALIDKWHSVLESNKPANGDAKPAAATNGSAAPPKSAKAAVAEDSNKKAPNGTAAKAEDKESKMDEDSPSAEKKTDESAAPATEESKPAEGMDNLGDESILADVTMSEVGAE